MRRGYRHQTIGLAALALLAGCAAAPPGVIPAQDNAYRLSVSGARYDTQADTNLKALSAANAYCDKKGQHMMFRQSTESGDRPWSPKQEDLTFVCMDANDPAFMQAAASHAVPVVAQQ
jgi:hypothetical protein